MIGLVEPAAHNHPGQQPAHLAYLPGLDGLRALAVVAVLLYHAGYPVVGGYLGVESFFVLSGFLITALLVAEWQRNARINAPMFWLRRARRLLPALIITLAGTLILTAVLVPGELRALAGDSLAALLYVMNWKLVLGQQSYFDALTRPSLLQHLWSLAIEEQFYLLWPLAFALGVRLLRPAGFLIAVIAAAFASALLMGVLYEPGIDPSRVYYGTDTRASALLIGAALALVWAPDRSAPTSRRYGLILDVAGLGALVGLLAAYGWLFEQHPLLYRGGFQLVALATALLIIAATYPGARALPALLELGPLRWIGVRSYSLYLWHWPIFLVTRPGIDISWSGWPLELLRFGLTFALAAASYRLVEQPIRRHGFACAYDALRAGIRAHLPGRVPRWRRLAASVCAVFLVMVGTVSLVLRPINAAVPRDHTSTAAAPPRAGTAQPAVPAQAESPAPAGTDAAAVPRDARADATATARDLLPDDGASAASPAGASVEPVVATPAAPGLDPALTGELQQLLDTLVGDGYVPGAVLSVSVPGYAPWNGASGLADREQQRPMEPDTPIRIASVSKLFTAVVVLQLVEEGIIALDAPIGTWLPDRVPNADTITVRHLLQHTSGLYDYLEDRAFVAQTQREPEREWQPQELVDYATRFPAGSVGRWDYSSTNYVLLGMLVEQVTQQSLAQQMRQRIFEPLGLRNTFFLPQEAPQSPLAHSYTQRTDITGASMSFAFATGNIATTAEDLQRFGRALFEETLLRPETREQMLQFVSGRGQYDMPDLAYGLGVMRNRLPIDADHEGQARAAEANLVLGHIGGYGGFRAALWYAPDSGVVIAISLNQAQTDPNDLATAVLDQVLHYTGR